MSKPFTLFLFPQILTDFFTFWEVCQQCGVVEGFGFPWFLFSLFLLTWRRQVVRSSPQGSKERLQASCRVRFPSLLSLHTQPEAHFFPTLPNYHIAREARPNNLPEILQNPTGLCFFSSLMLIKGLSPQALEAVASSLLWNKWNEKSFVPSGHNCGPVF